MPARGTKNTTAFESAASNIMQTGRGGGAQSMERQMSYERTPEIGGKNAPIYWQIHSKNPPPLALDNSKRIEEDQQMAAQHRRIATK